MENPSDVSAAIPFLLFLGLVLVFFVAVSWRRHNTKLELAHRVAQDRAEALLKVVLTPEEYASLGERGYLEVPSPSQPTRTYCVPRGRGRVAVQENGLIVESLCVAPVEWLPPGDVVLTHKLMIEGDEQEYLRHANRYRLKVPTRPTAPVS